MKANMCSDLKPKYIELYSRKPPSIAPSIFEEKATVTEDVFFNSFENANPEKKMGKVSITVIINLFMFSGRFSVFIKVNKNPQINEINSNP